MRALALLPLLWAAGASAEKWVYSAYVGGGVGVHLAPAASPQAAGSVLLESVLGLTDELNLEAPGLIELGPNPSVAIGTGLEYVYWRSNHWRLDIGAGASLRYAFASGGSLRFAPYLMAAARWLFTWGAGASLSLHCLVPVGPPTGEPRSLVVAYPSLSLYQEFW